MSYLTGNRRMLGLAAAAVVLVGLFIHVALRAGPLAPVPVTVATVESRAVAPARFGIGTVEARHVYRVGPTVAGRVRRVEVQVGERVVAGQLLGEMDPVDQDERLRGFGAALKRAEAGTLAALAQVEDVTARKAHAEAQVGRYERLLLAHAVTREAAETRRQELRIAEAGFMAARANLEAARQESARLRADYEGLASQRASLRLLAPADGLVTSRDIEPGTTVVAGQAVVEMIDPASLWIDVRFDQASAAGLRADLSARIALRSRADRALVGRVLRVEPRADAVTEETRAKVVFDSPPELPPLGELAEVTVALPTLAATPVVSNASLHRLDDRIGVWVVEDHDNTPRFQPVTTGASDLAGWVQVTAGLKAGEKVVVHSPRALAAGQRITIVDRLPGLSP